LRTIFLILCYTRTSAAYVTGVGEIKRKKDKLLGISSFLFIMME